MGLKNRLKVLVVDDMKSSRDLISLSLRKIGVSNVTAVSSGAEAITHLAQHDTHLVLSDYNMPNMDGLSLLERLRAAPGTKKVGFIVVTGRSTPELVRKGQELEMNNMIRKPFSAEQMRTCIERVVGPL